MAAEGQRAAIQMPSSALNRRRSTMAPERTRHRSRPKPCWSRVERSMRLRPRQCRSPRPLQTRCRPMTWSLAPMGDQLKRDQYGNRTSSRCPITTKMLGAFWTSSSPWCLTFPDSGPGRCCCSGTRASASPTIAVRARMPSSRRKTSSPRRIRKGALGRPFSTCPAA